MIIATATALSNLKFRKEDLLYFIRCFKAKGMKKIVKVSLFINKKKKE